MCLTKKTQGRNKLRKQTTKLGIAILPTLLWLLPERQGLQRLIQLSKEKSTRRRPAAGLFKNPAGRGPEGEDQGPATTMLPPTTFLHRGC